MDARPVEAVLTEVGKAFRLCRLYPSSHPAVQHTLSELAGILPSLASVGPVELKIGSTGFTLGVTPLAQRNTQIQELAGLLYAQGHRLLALEPGLTADEVALLIQVAGVHGKGRPSVAGASSAGLVHVRLEKSVGRASRATGQVTAAGAAPLNRASVGAAPAPVRRATGEFRPDALPPDIEAHRLMAELGTGPAPDAAIRALARLGELLADLLAMHDLGTLAEIVIALARGAAREEPALATTARRALAESLPPAALAALLGRVTDPRAPAVARDTAAHALGVAGARGMPLVVEAYLVGDDELRGVLGAVVRRAGEDGVDPILRQMQLDARPDHATAYARLLGTTASTRAIPPLQQLGAHADAAVREAAVEALQKVGGPDAERALAGALRDASPAVRASAARAVAWLGAAGVAPNLLARLGEEEDQHAAIALIFALGELREPRAVAVLTSLAEGVSGVFRRHPVAVRAAALGALGAIGGPEAVLVLRAHADGRHAELRDAARAALARGEAWRG